MRNFYTGLVMIALLSAPAIAADPAKDKKNDPEKIICKADKTTGSAISSRICKKRSEWDDEKYRTREFLDDRGRVGQQQGVPGGGGG